MRALLKEAIGKSPAASRLVSRLAVAGMLVAATVAAVPTSAQPTPVRVIWTTAQPIGGVPPVGSYCQDLMAAIAEKAGLQFEYAALPVGQLLPALTDNTADVVCSIPATNPNRSMGFAFTGGILTQTDGLIVMATDNTAYRGLDDLRGFPVGAATGTSFLADLRTAGLNVVEFPTSADAYRALIAGQVRAVVSSKPGFGAAQRLQGLWPELKLADAWVSLSATQNAIAVRSADTELLGAIQAALESLKADGTVATMIERWAQLAPTF